MTRKLYLLAALAIPSLGHACDAASAVECDAKSQRPSFAADAASDAGKKPPLNQRRSPLAAELRCHQNGVTIVQESVAEASALPSAAIEIGVRADGRRVYLWSVGKATCLIATRSSALPAVASALPVVGNPSDD